MLALTVKEGRWFEMMSPADASEVEESQGINNYTDESIHSHCKRKRTERFLDGRVNTSYRQSSSLEASLSWQTTSEDSQEDGVPTRKRESKCKRCCCVPLTRLATAFNSITKQHAKTLQWRKAKYKLKRTTHGRRSIDNTMLFNNTTLLNRSCLTSQHY